MEVFMKIYKKIIILSIIIPSCLFVFTSCERLSIGFEIGNNTDSYREATEFICSRVWVDDWVDSDGNSRHQELRFAYNNVGQDYIRVIDRRGNIQEYTYNFVWDWFSANYTSLRLKYSNGVSYMDNMYMGNNVIECLFDGEPVTFYGR